MGEWRESWVSIYANDMLESWLWQNKRQYVSTSLAIDWLEMFGKYFCLNL